MITKYAFTPFGMIRNPHGEYMIYESYRETVEALIKEIVELNEELKRERGKNAT